MDLIGLEAEFARPAGYAISTLVMCAVSYAIYRLHFDPLAKFPGPKLAALTRWYEAYYDYVKYGQYVFKIAELHKQYGPIIRISPYELHISDSAAFPVLHQQGGGRWDKYGFQYNAFHARKSTIMTLDHDLHRRRRSAYASSFSRPAVTAHWPMISDRVETLSSRIDEFEASGEVMPIGVAFIALTSDIATEIIMGQSYGNLKREDFNAPLSNFVQGATGLWQGCKHVPFYMGIMIAGMSVSKLFGVLPAGFKAFSEYRKKNRKRAEFLYDRYQIYGSNDAEYVPNIVEQALASPNLSDLDKTLDRIEGDVQTIVGAGIDTTAATLRNITFWLWSSPAVLKRLRTELLESGKAGGIDFLTTGPSDWSLAQLERLPYLQATIMEGLRLSPGVVSRLTRIAPDRDIELPLSTTGSSAVIPAGTPVGMTLWLMHHDESIFPDPTRFDPGRWSDVSPEQRRVMERNWAPFSKGTRNCLGIHLAWAELYVTVAMLVTRFEFELAGTQRSDVEMGYDAFGLGPKTRNGVNVRVKRLEDRIL